MIEWPYTVSMCVYIEREGKYLQKLSINQSNGIMMIEILRRQLECYLINFLSQNKVKKLLSLQWKSVLIGKRTRATLFHSTRVTLYDPTATRAGRLLRSSCTTALITSYLSHKLAYNVLLLFNSFSFCPFLSFL